MQKENCQNFALQKNAFDKFDQFQRTCIILLTSWFPTGNTHRMVNKAPLM